MNTIRKMLCSLECHKWVYIKEDDTSEIRSHWSPVYYKRKCKYCNLKREKLFIEKKEERDKGVCSSSSFGTITVPKS